MESLNEKENEIMRVEYENYWWNEIQGNPRKTRQISILSSIDSTEAKVQTRNHCHGSLLSSKLYCWNSYLVIKRIITRSKPLLTRITYKF